MSKRLNLHLVHASDASNLANPLIAELSCTLLPGKFTDGSPVPKLYNHVYEYWKKTWAEFFRKMGSPPDSLNIENFMRHSFLIVLHQQDHIVGTLLSSVFNLSALTTYDHPCIKPFPSDLLERIKAAESGRCMTGEYLSVHPDYRKSVVGMSMADALTGVLLKIFVQQRIEIAFGATVRAAKVDEICRVYGYKEVGSYLKMGVDCVMLYNTQDNCREHADPAVRGLVRKLWENRTDWTGVTVTPDRERNAA